MAFHKISRSGANAKAVSLDKDHNEAKMTPTTSQGGYHLPLLVRGHIGLMAEEEAGTVHLAKVRLLKYYDED